ncbi:hypothetical protein [Thermodesulfovibrio yellowstonii]|jgi:hypothetical protein|nr:hypothetical protein [Thermodesulfovibrio yellowstonii]
MKKFRIFVMLFFIFYFYSFAIAADQRYNLSIENSPVIGNKDAPVTIIEFIDYQ